MGRENNLLLFYVSICYGDIRVYTFIVKDALFPLFYVNKIGLVMTVQLF